MAALTPLHGYTRPEAVTWPGGPAFDRAMERSASLYELLATASQPKPPMRCTWRTGPRHVQMNARRPCMLELRSGPQNHPAYEVAQDMHRLIAEQAGHRGRRMMRRGLFTPARLERLESERRAEARRESMIRPGCGIALARKSARGIARRCHPTHRALVRRRKTWRTTIDRGRDRRRRDDELIDADIDEDLDDDLDDEIDGEDVVPDEELVAVVVDDVETRPMPMPPPPPAKGRSGDDDDEDDDDVDPDDVEEDLDTILKDRIAAGADDDDEDDEEAPVEDRSDGGDRIAPRAAEEFSCNECFLLVRRSQFSAKRTDCPGGLDGEDCPVKKELGLA